MYILQEIMTNKTFDRLTKTNKWTTTYCDGHPQNTDQFTNYEPPKHKKKHYLLAELFMLYYLYIYSRTRYLSYFKAMFFFFNQFNVLII